MTWRRSSKEPRTVPCSHGKENTRDVRRDSGQHYPLTQKRCVALHVPEGLFKESSSGRWINLSCLSPLSTTTTNPFVLMQFSDSAKLSSQFLSKFWCFLGVRLCRNSAYSLLALFEGKAVSRHCATSYRHCDGQFGPAREPHSEVAVIQIHMLTRTAGGSKVCCQSGRPSQTSTHVRVAQLTVFLK